MINNKGIISTLSNEAVLRQMDRMLSSDEFQVTESQHRFFEFIISETLENRQDQVNGYAIATKVLGRPADFNSVKDPIVSIHAKKLRWAIERYYLTSGTQDDIRIEIPKGTYIPRFYVQNSSGTSNAPANETEGPVPARVPFPTIEISPFVNLTDIPALGSSTEELAWEISLQLGQSNVVDVLSNDGQETISDNTNFLIKGNFQANDDTIKITIQLIDISTSTLVWSNIYKADRDVPIPFEILENIAYHVAAVAGSEHGRINQVLSAKLANKPVSHLTSSDAMSLFCHFRNTLNPDLYENTSIALEKAYIKNQDCYRLSAKLGRLYALDYAFEFTDSPKSMNEIMNLVGKACQLNPGNKHALLNQAFVLWLADEIDAAKLVLNKVADVAPVSIFEMDRLGMLMIFCGQWDDGLKLLEKSTQWNPYHDPMVYYAQWLADMHRCKFASAYLNALKFNVTNLFWEPLMKAIALAGLKKYDDAKKELNTLIQLKPDFSFKGRSLMSRLIKSEKMLEQCIKFLQLLEFRIE